MKGATTYNASLKERFVDDDGARRLIPMAEAHEAGIAAVAVDTAHDTLVVAEEEDGQAGHEVDGDQERALLVLAGHVPTADAIHDGRFGSSVVLQVYGTSVCGSRFFFFSHATTEEE